MRFSIVIPTYQRRDIVVRTVSALERQVYRDFEIVVVVDGSTDGTAEALRDLRMQLPVTVLEQANKGRAAAVNSGAAASSGELLLFLDDDMEADTALLAEHDLSHRKGADVVLGHLPLHPDSPPTALAAVTGRWAERRRARLSAPGVEIPISDYLTGQMSIDRSDFERLGGFDVSFTRNGIFGGEDLDLGYRAVASGLRVVFNESAISYQYYDIDPAAYTRRSRQAGRAAHELSVKHPAIAKELRERQGFATRRSRIVLGALAALPPVASRPVREIAVRLFRRAEPGPRSNRFFFAVQAMERVRGARQARQVLRTPLAVALAYHAIDDLHPDPILREYGVPPRQFASQLDRLVRKGWRFISLEQLLGALDDHVSLPARAVLLTFDDAYADLLTAACPILAERGIPATGFAVTGFIGRTNEWDQARGATAIRLLDEEGLRKASALGVRIASHGVTHRPLTGLSASELELEVRDSAQRLDAIGLGRAAAISYPHGEWDSRVTAAVQEAGYAAGFTVHPGTIRRCSNRYALPRIEVFARDTHLTIALKLASASWSDRWRKRLLARLSVPARR